MNETTVKSASKYITYMLPTCVQFHFSLFQAGIVSPDRPGQLLIALEPEAASIHCQRLRLFHVVPSATGEDSLSNSSQSSSTQELSSNIHNASFISNDIDIGKTEMECGM